MAGGAQPTLASNQRPVASTRQVSNVRKSNPRAWRCRIVHMTGYTDDITKVDLALKVRLTLDGK